MKPAIAPLDGHGIQRQPSSGVAREMEQDHDA
jgi:hypothetical protein